MVAGLKIVALGVVAAAIYGVLHNAVTAHVCLEFFTVYLPRRYADHLPIVHALGWGVVATWWIGLLIGVPLAIAATVGRAPTLTWRDLRVPTLYVMVATAVLSLCLGAAFGMLSAADLWGNTNWRFDRLSESRRPALLFAVYSTNAAHAIGVGLSLMLIMWTWKEREVRRWRAAATDQTSSDRTSSA